MDYRQRVFILALAFAMIASVACKGGPAPIATSAPSDSTKSVPTESLVTIPGLPFFINFVLTRTFQSSSLVDFEVELIPFEGDRNLIRGNSVTLVFIGYDIEFKDQEWEFGDGKGIELIKDEYSGVAYLRIPLELFLGDRTTVHRIRGRYEDLSENATVSYRFDAGLTHEVPVTGGVEIYRKSDPVDVPGEVTSEVTDEVAGTSQDTPTQEIPANPKLGGGTGPAVIGNLGREVDWGIILGVVSVPISILATFIITRHFSRKDKKDKERRVQKREDTDSFKYYVDKAKELMDQVNEFFTEDEDSSRKEHHQIAIGRILAEIKDCLISASQVLSTIDIEEIKSHSSIIQDMIEQVKFNLISNNEVKGRAHEVVAILCDIKRCL